MWEKVWGAGGEFETLVTPDEPDILDGGDVVEGVGVDGLAVDCNCCYRVFVLERSSRSVLAAKV